MCEVWESPGNTKATGSHWWAGGEGWGSVQPGLGVLTVLYGCCLHWVRGNGDHQSQLQPQSNVENLGVNTFRVEIHEAPVWGMRHGRRGDEAITKFSGWK